MKKILMVCESFGGGVFNYVVQLCNAMVSEFEVYLVYSIRPQTPVNYKELINPIVHLIEIQDWRRGLFINVIKYFRILVKLKRVEKEISPDIIHLHSSIAGAMGRIAYNKSCYRVVYTPHGYAHILMGDGGKKKLYEIVEKILGRGNCITLTCCESEDEIAKSICKKTTYIETGLNITEMEKALDGVCARENNHFTVFALGRACKQKNPSLFNHISQLVPEAKFVWIGDGELRKELKDCDVTGWKERENALEIAKNADVYVLCSNGEAISMSLIESMFMKKLVLVSNSMGNRSVIRDGINGYICETAEDYAIHIRDAMKEFPCRLVDRAYQDVLEKYNIEIMMKQYKDFYNALIERQLNEP